MFENQHFDSFFFLKKAHCNEGFSSQEISHVNRLIKSVRFSSVGDGSAAWTAASWHGLMNSGRENSEAEERS